MKKIYKDKILNIPETDMFDNTFLFEYLENITSSSDRKIIYISELLEARKNADILQNISQKPAMYSEVYSPKDELEIFTSLFEKALRENKKIHIV